MIYYTTLGGSRLQACGEREREREREREKERGLGFRDSERVREGGFYVSDTVKEKEREGGRDF